MKLKVCGMKYNPEEVAQLQPDYLGFIFWTPSSRFYDSDSIADVPKNIKKVGVFVDASIEGVFEKIETYELDGVQLHGNESPEFCRTLKEEFIPFRAQSRKKIATNSKEVSTAPDLTKLEIIKVFSIKNDFDFSVLSKYENVCDYFLFDTKGRLPGGNGYIFDWNILTDYPSTKPYFLSGGIGLDEVNSLRSFLDSPASKMCYAIDVNSKFESEPGLKKIQQLKEFKKLLSNNFQLKSDNS
ncbi:Phosphoribosylanthranilate isomerase [Flagellimonas maritima]|uniref:N-(5'-phosphoribosyl)anthranilate isomerase n=1 Tax=Flagellimonas maritima TaxID=1383885 RepID=A0A2Z4LU56_9FLAO|nr:phosphoribosylanthranilate isomerase [Allomuricauda aurantiaca]AWX45431.1 Phosphoribosylanthranilate isomerase [Allomuricauda aurantiaca]